MVVVWYMSLAYSLSYPTPPVPTPTKQEPRVALFDATNTTKARRATLLARNRKETNATLLFVESICDDQVRAFYVWLPWVG